MLGVLGFHPGSVPRTVQAPSAVSAAPLPGPTHSP